MAHARDYMGAVIFLSSKDTPSDVCFEDQHRVSRRRRDGQEPRILVALVLRRPVTLERLVERIVTEILP